EKHEDIFVGSLDDRSDRSRPDRGGGPGHPEQGPAGAEQLLPFEVPGDRRKDARGRSSGAQGSRARRHHRFLRRLRSRPPRQSGDLAAEARPQAAHDAQPRMTRRAQVVTESSQLRREYFFPAHGLKGQRRKNPMTTQPYRCIRTPRRFFYTMAAALAG